MEGQIQGGDAFEKSAWQMVLLAIVVILFLTLFLLGVQIYHQTESFEDISLTEGPYVYYTFLAILVLLFCSYMVAQHRRHFQLSKTVSEQKKQVKMLSSDIKMYESLLQVSSIINSRCDLSDVLNAIANEILACFDADHASLMILNEKSNTIETKVSAGKDSDLAEGAVVPVGESIVGHVLQSGEPLLLNGTIGVGEYPGTTSKKRNITSSMCIPLKTSGKVIGVLNLNLVGQDRTFTDNDLKLINIFANNAVAAINDAKSYKQITSFNTHLKQTVKDRTRELEAANRIKSNFLSSVSHELRTPMTAIVGFSKILLDQNFGPLNERQKKYTQNIAESGNRLNSIIDDILDAAKLQARDFELSLQPFKIKAIMESAKLMLKEASSKKQMNCAVDVPDELQDLTIKADQTKIKQVLDILLSNAFKFTPENGSITLSARRYTISQSRGEGADKTRPRQFLGISVADTGIGIPPSEQEAVFKDFYQIKGGITGKSSGMGLGLGLAKRLVELHGGKIRLESEGVEKGSRFSVYIPLTT